MAFPDNEVSPIPGVELLSCLFLPAWCIYSWMLAQTSFLGLSSWLFPRAFSRTLRLRTLLYPPDFFFSSLLHKSEFLDMLCVCAETFITLSLGCLTPDTASLHFLDWRPLKNWLYHLTALCDVNVGPFLKLSELSAKIQMSAHILWCLNIYKLYVKLTHCYIKYLLFTYLD